jgi:UPF0716 protein FxsA
MPFVLILFILLVSVPLVEIYVLIQVGRVIGAGTTVVLVVFTAVLGAWLLRGQGLATVARARASLDQGQLPAQELVEGLILLLAGVLLLTPGFVTDALGFAALVPAVRHTLAGALAARLSIHAVPGRRPQPGPGPSGPDSSTRTRTIEADYRVERDDS